MTSRTACSIMERSRAMYELTGTKLPLTYCLCLDGSRPYLARYLAAVARPMAWTSASEQAQPISLASMLTLRLSVSLLGSPLPRTCAHSCEGLGGRQDDALEVALELRLGALVDDRERLDERDGFARVLQGFVAL